MIKDIWEKAYEHDNLFFPLKDPQKDHNFKYPIYTLPIDIQKKMDMVWDTLFEKIDLSFGKYLFFAGGCFQSLHLNEEVNDYDLFYSHPDYGISIEKEIARAYKNSIIDAKKSLYFYTGDYKINFIRKSFGTANKTVNLFDFKHAQSYYCGTGKTVLSPHLGKKNLVFNEGCVNGIGAVYRMKKFISRGYTIHSKEMEKVLMCAAKHTLSLFGTDTNIDKEWLEKYTGFYQ